MVINLLRVIAVGIFLCSTLAQVSASLAVTLSAPSNIAKTSLTLAWTQTATSDADFTCYKVLRTTYPGAGLEVTGVPALGPMGAVAMIFLFILAVAFRKGGGAAVAGGWGKSLGLKVGHLCPYETV